MKRKISEMLLAVAGDYISLGEDEEHKRQLLFGAASAWNVACLAASERERALQAFMTAYRNANPTQTPEDYADVEGDMRKLIQKKCQMFQDVNAQILNATLNEDDGKMHVTVASVRA